MEAVPFLLRGRWEEELDTVHLLSECGTVSLGAGLR